MDFTYKDAEEEHAVNKFKIKKINDAAPEFELSLLECIDLETSATNTELPRARPNIISRKMFIIFYKTSGETGSKDHWYRL